MKRIILIIIILIFPISALGHGDVAHLAADPGVLPGSIKYSFDRLGEWFEINLFTPSTKHKQEKRAKQAEERLAELVAMLELADQKDKYVEKARSGYETSLNQSEDMAEKIIFLDGAEIAIAYDLEKRTRIHEKVLVELLEEKPAKEEIAREVLGAARSQNGKIFKFIVEKYQFNDSDIERNKNIIAEEIGFVEKRVKDLGVAAADKNKARKISDLVAEAKKYNKLGLTVQAYDFIKQAKDILY